MELSAKAQHARQGPPSMSSISVDAFTDHTISVRGPGTSPTCSPRSAQQTTRTFQSACSMRLSEAHPAGTATSSDAPSGSRSAATAHSVVTTVHTEAQERTERAARNASSPELGIEHASEASGIPNAERSLGATSSGSDAASDYTYSSTSASQTSSTIEGGGPTGRADTPDECDCSDSEADSVSQTITATTAGRVDAGGERGYSYSEADSVSETATSRTGTRIPHRTAAMSSAQSESLLSMASSGPSHLEAVTKQISLLQASEHGQSELGVSALDSSEESSCISASSMCETVATQTFLIEVWY